MSGLKRDFISIIFIWSFLYNDFNLIMVASTVDTSFNKIIFNQKNFLVSLFIYRLKRVENN